MSTKPASRPPTPRSELARERETAELLYPVVVDDRLAGMRVAIVALGALSPELSTDVEQALEPTGATLSEVAVVSVPPDVDDAVSALPGARAEALSRGEAFELAARRAGFALAEGGPRFDEMRAAFLSSYSGQPEATDAVILVRQLPTELEGREAEDTERLEAGVVEGLRRAGVTMVGAERSDSDPSSIGAFNEHELSSVDSVDLLAGRVALVLALDGAEGVYGTKETADRLLPELVPPPAPPDARRAGALGRARGAAGGPVAARHGSLRAGAPQLRRARARLPRRCGADRLLAAGARRRLRSSTIEPTSTCSTPSCGAGSCTCSASPCWGCSTMASVAEPRPRPRAAGAAMPDAVLAGRFSTGAVKAAGALALAAYAVSGRGREGLDYVADLALLLLATNLFNLLDLRPGRVEKAYALLLAGLCLGGWTIEPLELLGIFIGPVLVGAAFTLRERAMLGDTGSNLVGALAGISLLITLSDDARLVALAIVAGLSIYGEFRSISAAIERLPLLRWLDSLGRVNRAREPAR